MKRLLLLSLAALLSPACTCGRREPASPPPPFADAAPRRPASPPGEVHAYPPHAIRSDGVGPYLLGEKVGQVLRELPEGPHLELVQVGRYANWRVVRAEGGAVVIGADASNEVAFVSVLRADVARTQAGIAVGASGAELGAALGAPRAAGGVIRDRRVLEHASLPGVFFLTDARVDAPLAGAHVMGVIVMRAPPIAQPDAGAGCPEIAASDEELVAAARLRLPAEAPRVRRGCVTGAVGEAVVIGDGELALVGGEPGKLRRLAAAPVGPVDFAGTLDLDGDRREEIIVGAQRRSAREHAVEVHALRWDAGKLVEVLAERPFVISDGTAAAAGVTPDQIDLAVEIRAARGGLEIGGFYTTRRGGELRELAPLAPVTLRVEVRRPGPPPPAGPVDAALAPDAGVEEDAAE